MNKAERLRNVPYRRLDTAALSVGDTNAVSRSVSQMMMTQCMRPKFISSLNLNLDMSIDSSDTSYIHSSILAPPASEDNRHRRVRADLEYPPLINPPSNSNFDGTTIQRSSQNSLTSVASFRQPTCAHKPSRFIQYKIPQSDANLFVSQRCRQEDLEDSFSSHYSDIGYSYMPDIKDDANIPYDISSIIQNADGSHENILDDEAVYAKLRMRQKWPIDNDLYNAKF